MPERKVKSDVKSSQLPRIIYLMILPLFVPLRFFFGCAVFIRALWLKPDRLTYKEFGIRVVTADKDDKTSDDFDKVLAALRLLKRYDKEELELIKKRFRIICLLPGETDEARARKLWKLGCGCNYIGTGVYSLNLRLFPADFSDGRRVVHIIGWLVYEVSRVKFAGKLGAYLRTSEEVKKLCKEDQERTLQKINDECS